MNVIRWIKQLDGIVAGIALSITTVVTILNVLMRYFFNSGLPWSQEVAATCFCWAVMLGMSYAYKHNMHYGVDFLIVKAPKNIRRYLYIMIYTILLIGCVALTFYSIQITIVGGLKVTGYLQMPYRYKYISAVIGFFLMCVYSIQYIYIAIMKKELFNEIVSQGGSGLADIN